MSILRTGGFTVCDNKTDYEALKLILKQRLNEKRYYHSLCVADEAKRLAEKYGGNAEKAYLAGLLHDITKNAPEAEHLKIFADFGIIPNEIEKGAEKLAGSAEWLRKARRTDSAGLLLLRKFDKEGVQAICTLAPDSAVVRVDDGLRDGEAEPEAAVAAARIV